VILGMTPLTFIHVLLNLVGIFSGFVVLYGFLSSKHLDGWNALCNACLYRIHCLSGKTLSRLS
jgi:hypothetical protein